MTAFKEKIFRRSSSIMLKIIDALQNTSKDDIQLKRYLQQLKMLARLRKLDNVVHEKINKMPIILDIRDSYDYKEGVKEGVKKGEVKGIEKGKEAGRLEAIVQLASSGMISIENAAKTLGISIEKMNLHLAEIKKDS